MLNPLRAFLNIGIRTSGVTLSGRRSFLRGRQRILAVMPLSGSQMAHTDLVFQALKEALSSQGCSRLQTRVVIGDDMVRYFMVHPTAKTSTLADCQALATTHFETLYSQKAHGWQVQGLWHPSLPFLAYAIPDCILHALTRVSRLLHLPLNSVLPCFINSWRQWNRRLGDDAWFGNVVDKTLCLAMVSDSRLHAVSTVMIPSETHAAWFPAYLEREASRVGLPFPRSVQFCGNIPPVLLKPGPNYPFCSRIDMGKPNAFHPHFPDEGKVLKNAQVR